MKRFLYIYSFVYLFIFSSMASCAEPTFVAEFNPDKVQLRTNDVLTGWIKLEYTGKEPIRLVGAFAEREGDFLATIVTPGLDTLSVWNQGQNCDSICSPEIQLNKGEFILKPVCLVSTPGELVFSSVGQYEVSFRLRSRIPAKPKGQNKLEVQTKKSLIHTIPPEGSDTEYLKFIEDVKPRLGTCGILFFEHSLDDISRMGLGEYEESVMAYLSYQVWGIAPRRILRIGKHRATQYNHDHVVKRLVNADPNIRGYWISKWILDTFNSGRSMVDCKCTACFVYRHTDVILEY